MPALSEPLFDPQRFFDSFPRFVDSSETGRWLERLNARYRALIHEHRHLLAGARVLDLASHDGRFMFAALQNGARHVVGIDVKKHLAENAAAHMHAYGITPDRYTFLVGDMFDCLDLHAPFDVVFCFGILYHINDHMALFNRIAEVGPRAIIIDSNISTLEGTVIELRSSLGKSPPPPGSRLQGYPTRSAFDAMFSSFGWRTNYFDWPGSGMCEQPNMQDYRNQRRLSAIVNCPEFEVPPAVREAAVQEVLDKALDRETVFILIAMVAERHGISPQALRTWVHQAQRQRSRASGFTE